MPAMFRDFSFDPVSPPAYSIYEAERAAMNVSPTSKPSAAFQLPSRAATPPCTIGDLAVQLNQQSLRIDTALDNFSCGPLSPPSDDCASPTAYRPRPTYSRVATSILRMQRQTNSRMQCCSSHVRDLSKLVQMIEREDQCNVSDRASSRTSSTSSTSTSSSSSNAAPSISASGDDEGVDMDYDAPARGIEALVGLPAWRAGERRDSCVRVPKQVRMRKRSKENGISKRRSS
ncbi:hypothetical protein IQ07DRAFT_590148 [Pyrenochaeta sp. DS3sAY3a]|nr:hypothetical protein IQ07DRAFT_590148 [Pyrenochaeta sp. DS3sAY3a]